MKKNLILFSVVFLFTTLVSCEAVKEKVTVSVNVPGPDLEFKAEPRPRVLEAPQKAPGASQALEILYEGTININIANELAKQNLSVDNIKSFLLLQSTLEIVPGQYTDANIDLNSLKDIKLFFDNTTQLVAKVKSVNLETKSLTFEVVNPELLEKLKENSLHVIVAKDTPLIYKVSFVLKTKYVARVGMR